MSVVFIQSKLRDVEGRKCNSAVHYHGSVQSHVDSEGVKT